MVNLEAHLLLGILDALNEIVENPDDFSYDNFIRAEAALRYTA